MKARFGEHFAKTGELDARPHRWLLDASDERIQGDYGFEAAITDEEARRLADQAAEFLREARRYLGDTSQRPRRARVSRFASSRFEIRSARLVLP